MNCASHPATGRGYDRISSFTVSSSFIPELPYRFAFRLHLDRLHGLPAYFDPASVTVSLIRYPAAAVILIAALFAAHVFLPARRTRFANIWPGVFFTVTAWTLLAAAFSFYLRTFGNYASYYAGLAGIIAALYFMYLAALVLIFGGELNRAIRIRRLARALSEGDGERNRFPS